VDISIRRAVRSGTANGRNRTGMTGEQIDLQLKATTASSLRPTTDGFMYDLDADNFNDLVRRRGSLIPLLLVVLHLPDEEAEWLTLSPDQLVTKRCCYWFSAAPTDTETTNTETKAVLLSNTNRLDLDTIPGWFEDHFGPVGES